MDSHESAIDMNPPRCCREGCEEIPTATIYTQLGNEQKKPFRMCQGHYAENMAMAMRIKEIMGMPLKEIDLTALQEDKPTT